MNDLHQVAALSKVWEEEDITYGLKGNSIDDLLHYVSNEFWIVIDHEKVIGYLIGEVKKNEGFVIFEESEQSYFEIDEIYIDPDYRERKIGSVLLSEVTSHVKEKGTNRIIVSSANKDLKKTMEFYEKNGFQSWTITLFK
ncbi:GNAT family N-acetyltransferase [Paenibacillus sp. EC2-1]|uniref:GNAT family N-acetyltransferase n=1 Tax=Paenibacillus sp. EC2-1 TaxID=3388665 RepID=UPI003BEF1352